MAVQIPDIAPMRLLVQQGHSRSYAWRMDQLQRLRKLLLAIEKSLLAALAVDLGKPALEGYLEISGVMAELNLAQGQLRNWMAPKPVAVPYVHLPAQAWVQPEPLGCVLVLGPWNYPFMLLFKPLVAALAAGNTAVLKPSEQTAQVAALLAEAVANHFDPSVVALVQGGASTAQELLQLPFDHIFFTGGAKIGRQVMLAAAAQLIPVTLELGGKNPCIVLDDANLEITARRIAWGKFFNAGQTCVAPDYVLATAGIRKPLEEAIKAAVESFFGSNPSLSASYGRLVNQAQFDRLEALLEGTQLLSGGQRDRKTLYFAPTLVSAELSQPIMQEEIFGPLLPFLEVADLASAIALVNQGEHPLAIYLFSQNRKAQEVLLNSSQSGGVVLNDVVLQAAFSTLPFGGVGASGMGRGHGRHGFETFSNLRSILKRGFQLDLPFRYPPYGNRLSWLRRFLD